MSEGEFLEWLEKSRSLMEKRQEQKNRTRFPFHARIVDVNLPGLIATLYYTGLRITEIVGDSPHLYRLKNGTEKWTDPLYGLRKKDLNVVGDLLKVDVKEVRKHGKRQAPVWIKLVRPGVDDILDAWQVAGGSEDRVFPCSKWLAWKLISLVSERRLYPHYFRYNRASRFAENPETSLKELKDWFAWSDIKTAGSYMLKSGRTTKKMADRL